MKLGVWQKDMQIIGEFAREVDADAALRSHRPLYAAAIDMGRQDEDTAAVCAVLERLAGLDR